MPDPYKPEGLVKLAMKHPKLATEAVPHISQLVRMLCRGVIGGLLGVLLSWLFGISGEQRDWFLVGSILINFVFHERPKGGK